MWKVLMIVVTGCLAVATASVLRLTSEGVPFEDCGSKGGKISSLEVKPCEGPICKFPRATNVTVKLGFKSSKFISSAKTKVHGIIEGIPVLFPLSDSNACDDMKCPVNTGSDVVYNNVIFVKKEYPKIKLVVKWEIIDNTDKDVICFVVPAEITD